MPRGGEQRVASARFALADSSGNRARDSSENRARDSSENRARDSSENRARDSSENWTKPSYRELDKTQLPGIGQNPVTGNWTVDESI
jgi:hypothetical protein